MDGVHFHLVICHIPIIFPIVGIIVLILGIISKSIALIRTGFLIFILGSLATIFAFISGEVAEEISERVYRFDISTMYIHKKAAEKFAILNYILGVISLMGIWVSFKKRKFLNIFSIIIIIFSIILMYYAKKTGNTGGEIRHSEIRKENLISK